MDGRPDWAALLPDPSKPALIMQKLIVTDSVRSLAFYTEALGMKILYRIEGPDIPFSEILLGYNENPAGARLVISSPLRKGLTPGMAPYGTPFPKGVPFTNTLLLSPDIPALASRIESFGGRVAMAPHKTDAYRKGGALLLFAQDPDGHVLEFFQFAPFYDAWPDFNIFSPPEGLLALYGEKAAA